MKANILILVLLGLVVAAHAQAENQTNETMNAATMHQFTSTRNGSANMCPNLQYAFRGICVDTCPIGYAPDNETRTCMKTAAINCTNNTFAFNGACVTVCPEGYVANTVTQSCLRNATDLLIGDMSQSATSNNETAAANETQKDANMNQNATTADAKMTQTDAKTESQAESDKKEPADASAQDEGAKRRLRFRL